MGGQPVESAGVDQGAGESDDAVADGDGYATPDGYQEAYEES
jgi:hypothetical protein